MLAAERMGLHGEWRYFEGGATWIETFGVWGPHGCLGVFASAENKQFVCFGVI